MTRKITRQVAEIVVGQRKQIVLGNMDARRDWGYAPDFVEAMFLPLQHDEPGDFVIGTGVSRTIKEFRDVACACAGIKEPWTITRTDSSLYRPAEVNDLRADPTKAREKLGWSPRTPFDEWVARMVRHDIKAAIKDSPGRTWKLPPVLFSGFCAETRKYDGTNLAPDARTAETTLILKLFPLFLRLPTSRTKKI